MAGAMIRQWDPGSDVTGPPDEVLTLGGAVAKPEDYIEGNRTTPQEGADHAADIAGA